MAGKTFTKIAMSKPVGKILNSGVGKGMVKVGNAVIKGAKAPGRLVVGAIKKEDAMAKAKNQQNIKNAPRGAYGTSTYQSQR